MAAQGVCPWVLPSVALLLLFCIAGSQSAEQSKNYYDVLSVERSATHKQIKKAFHAQAMKYHPDKNKSADAEKLFRAAAEAYEVLSNKEKRKLYDRLGHDAFKEDGSFPNPEPSFNFNFNFNDMFSDYFEDDDEDPFMREAHSRWRFAEAEDDPSVRYSYRFQEPMFFGRGDTVYVDENEEDFIY
ncbi:dnaJ homolog subfamily B member 9-like [Genypterus blacodes]|uniref:dnaJ homolog subfamily B member 9-like n=1 Tax=Genypterus blacodes TaxID=154954 RepID=UPI003F76E9FF